MTVGKLVPFIDNSYVSNKFIDIESAPNDEYLRGDGTWQTAATIVGTGLLLDTLGDVNLTTPADDDILTYDSASSKWINQSSLNLTDLILTGNLTVQGTTTTVDSTTMTVVDPILTLQTVSGGGVLTTDTNKDVGLALQYHTGSAPKTAFVGLDDSEGKLTFIPDATITSEVVSGTKGTIVANLEGNADTVTDGVYTTDIGSTVQAYDATIVVDADIGSTVQAYDAELTAIAGLTPLNGNIIVGDGSTWVAESAETARISLGLGTVSTHSLSSVLSMAAGSASAKYSSATNNILKSGLGTIATHSLSSVLAMTQNQNSYGSKTEKILKKGLGTIASKDFATVMMAFDHRTSLKTLSDTVIDSQTLADNDFLIFNASDSKWYNRSTSTSRTKMGVAIGTDVQAHDAALDSLALVSSATGNIIVGAGGGGWTAESGATARASLGLGSIATKSLAAVLAMTQGTGAAAAASTTSEIIYILLEAGGGLGGQKLENEADTNNTNFILMPDTGDNYNAFPLTSQDIGVEIQAYDATILVDADIGSTVQAYDSTILKSADIGSTVQAYDADLAVFSGLSNADSNFIVGTGSSWTVESGATVRTSLGLGSIATHSLSAVLSMAAGATKKAFKIGVDVQAWDAELDALAATTSAADKGIYYTGSGTASTFDLTSQARTFLAGASVNDQRNALTLGTGYTPNFLAVNCIGSASLKLPVGPTSDRGMGVGHVQGAIRYNTTDSGFEGHDGTSWGAIGGGSSASRSTYTAVGGETSVNVTYTPGQLSVYLNGVKLVDSVDYTATNGTSITGLSPALIVNDVVDFVALGTFTVADVVPASTGGTFGGQITVPNSSPLNPHQVSDASSSQADIEGTYRETMMIADTFNVTGTTTLSANFYLSKITDDGNPVTITGSGTITGTGSMIARFPFQADFPKVNRKNLGLGHHGDGIATRSLATAMLLTPTWGKAKTVSEGIDVKSTGEVGGTKFLREDGDGTCSWQSTPTATDFVSAASGGTFGGDVSIGSSGTSNLYARDIKAPGGNLTLNTQQANQNINFMPNGVGLIQAYGTFNTFGDITATGDITSGASDERLKENIEPINNAIEKVKQIKGVTFDWINNIEELVGTPWNLERQAGVFAQDVQKVLPEVVQNAPFDLDENKKSKSGKDYLTVKYEHLVPLLIEAIKEQQKQIDELIQAKE